MIIMLSFRLLYIHFFHVLDSNSNMLVNAIVLAFSLVKRRLSSGRRCWKVMTMKLTIPGMKRATPPSVLPGYPEVIPSKVIASLSLSLLTNLCTTIYVVL